ncbi:MAG: ABC transporter ATP-binding protein [Verrucomicrobiota bacterium]|jgi:subfamily B ATP-binding cassette protein MsbA
MTDFLRRLLSLAKPYRLRLALGIAFGFLSGLVEPLLVLIIPLVGLVVFTGAGADSATAVLKNLSPRLQTIANTIASWFSQSESSPATVVKILVILLVPFMFILRGLFGYLNVYCLQWVAIRAITDLRTRLFAHLQNLSVGFFVQSSTGDLMSRINSDTSALQSAITAPLAVIVKDPVTVIGMVIYLLILDAKLMLVIALIFPVCLIPIIIYSRKVRKSSAVIQDSYSELSTVMHESFTGNRIIKAYNLEEKAVQQFKEVSQRFISHRMRVIRSEEIPGPLIEFFASVGVALLFIYFAFQSSSHAVKFVQFAIGVFLMYRPIKNVIRLQSQLQQARAASQRVFDLLAMQNSVCEPAQPVPLRATGAAVCFDHVCFSYGDKEVLKDIQLTVPAGRMVALVGASGSGKTTLSNLLLRFYDPTRGAIRIGDVDIREVTTRDLRSQIAVVTQEIILFNDTVSRNIELGRPGATKEEIIAAARHANAHDFITENPKGYDTVIGEKGVMFSGGQRQRLAIARAVLRNAPILILDEATSALDTESERAVQAALEKLMQGRTTICIAHRLSTIQKADLIVVLDQGRIVETGTHTELVQRSGVYQKLYELQFAS